MRTWILATLVIAGLTGCEKKDKDDDKKAPAPDPAAPQPTDPAKDPVAPPDKPPEPPKGAIVDPATVPADKVFSVAELNGYLAGLKADLEVTITGYATFSVGDSDVLRSSIYLGAQPGQTQDRDKDLHCWVVPADKDKQVDNKTLLTFKGKLGPTYDYAKTPPDLLDCTLVSQGSGTANVATLVNAYKGWFGREVQVKGHYFGQTVSKKLPKDGGAIIDVRVDLLRAGGDFDMKVGCHLPLVEPAKELVAIMEKNRDGLTVKGKLKEFSFGEPQLDPCEIVSQ